MKLPPRSGCSPELPPPASPARLAWPWLVPAAFSLLGIGLLVLWTPARPAVAHLPAVAATAEAQGVIPSPPAIAAAVPQPAPAAVPSPDSSLLRLGAPLSPGRPLSLSPSPVKAVLVYGADQSGCDSSPLGRETVSLYSSSGRLSLVRPSGIRLSGWIDAGGNIDLVAQGERYRGWVRGLSGSLTYLQAHGPCVAQRPVSLRFLL